MRNFLLLFLLSQLLELFVFIQVSSTIGFFPAVLLIILGSMLGFLVLRIAGLTTVLRVSKSLSRGKLPAQPMLTGLMAALAGCLLILPGFISDAVGLSILLLFTCKLLVSKTCHHAFGNDTSYRSSPYIHDTFDCKGDVIEGEFEHRYSK
ncbi:phage T7 F exclusion suppressor FxsA [Candidatus Pseudomonas adelgestsugas]|uniref:Phage T7 F exclusion suppressor FxsA n=1 Tax=Candidatus Pseudomonas adelgestsugas TaxID=1302376 RepID=A0ABX5RAK7_9PSED|nr:FxsA family protein [Candidatus Pseudomonas adelgestsugas]QAX82233.1 phage T7 F exclusion suppressor FxsA [Candidatus Pseudomonas adelgestsugas]